MAGCEAAGGRVRKMSTIRSNLAEAALAVGAGAAFRASAVRAPAIEPSQVLDQLPAAVYITDAEGRITYFNEAAAALWGCRPKLNSDQWCGSWRLYWPDGRPMRHDECPMAVAVKNQRMPRGGEAISERPDGTRVPFMAFPTPLFDPSGAMIGAVNMLLDMSDRQRGQRAAHQLAAIVESSDDAIVSKDLNGIIATWNKAAERLFGYFAEEVIGKPITIIIPHDRLDEEIGILQRLRRGERIDHFETVRQRKDGSLINISLTISPVTDDTGRVIGASKIARDITEQKRREEQIALLAREAEHRTKNLLALAQATVHLSEADTPDELKEVIDGRLQALAKAHTLLARSRWAGADLGAIVIDELSPYMGNGDARVEISGPKVMLDPDPAQAAAMAVHELSTNAAKYGALSVPEGRVRVEWRLEPGGRLRLHWIETGGPPVTLPRRQGFGTRVMQRMVCGQCNGDIDFDWRAEGLVCEITVAA